ncbi:hypothetical protein R80B4_00640 [Fibrobacteres bacterium R8-0-B4]
MSTVPTTIPTDSEKFIGRGDFTKERHDRPKRPKAEIVADIERLQAEYPERLTIRPVR